MSSLLPFAWPQARCQRRARGWSTMSGEESAVQGLITLKAGGDFRVSLGCQQNIGRRDRPGLGSGGGPGRRWHRAPSPGAMKVGQGRQQRSGFPGLRIWLLPNTSWRDTSIFFFDPLLNHIIFAENFSLNSDCFESTPGRLYHLALFSVNYGRKDPNPWRSTRCQALY